MKYEVWKKHRSSDIDEILCASDRAGAVAAVRDLMQKGLIQAFSNSGCTGSIYGYCIEYSENKKPCALLYDHPEYGLIWLEIQ